MDAWGGDEDDDAAMLSELLALLADDPPSDDTSPSDETSPTPCSTRRPSINSTARRKKEIDRLRCEVTHLSEERNQLRATSRSHPYAGFRERAAKERHARRRAEQERAALHAALAKQSVFLNGLYEVFTMAPRLAVIHHFLRQVVALALRVSPRRLEPRRGVFGGRYRLPVHGVELGPLLCAAK